LYPCFARSSAPPDVAFARDPGCRKLEALIVAIVPISILIVLFQERVVGGLTAGGVKG
jgi:hypothetical protein